MIEIIFKRQQYKQFFYSKIMEGSQLKSCYHRYHTAFVVCVCHLKVPTFSTPILKKDAVMGLLTDPSGLRGKPFQFLVKNHGIICALLYFGSLIWFCLLAHDQINSATYLSENALLPGLVSLGSDVYIDPILKEYDALDDIQAWLRGKMRDMGIESYVHNFTLNNPFNGQSYYGRNVYGIIRGGSSSNEAIVLSAPYRPKESPYASSKVSIALLLAISSYFRQQKYWAKDIIILVTQHELLGTQAWLEAYHRATCGVKGVLDSGELEARGGSIQAALNLEIESVQIERLEIKLLGLNGQLPNLDLVNLVHRICAKERVKHSFAGREKVHNLTPKEQYLNSLRTMATMVLGQATGIPDGNHGLFHRFGIEAVTIQGEEKTGQGNGVPMRSIGRVIEGVFRSINNLLERFHQSYFFYILTDTDRFISIALYIVSIGALSAPLLIKAFSDQVSLRSLSDKKPKNYSYNIGGVFVAYLCCFAIGIASFYTPNVLTFFYRGVLNTKQSISYGFLGLSLMSVLTIEIYTLSSKAKDWSLLKIAGLIHGATLILAVAMSNFSLAFVVGALICPIVLIVIGTQIRLRWLLCFFVHPLSLAFLFVYATNAHRGESILKVIDAVAESITLSTLDYHIYRSMIVVYATLAYTPLWHLCYFLSRAKQVDVKVKKD